MLIKKKSHHCYELSRFMSYICDSSLEPLVYAAFENIDKLH